MSPGVTSYDVRRASSVEPGEFATTTHDARRTTRNPYVLAFGTHDPRKNIRSVERIVHLLRQEVRWHDLELVTVNGNISDEELCRLYEHAAAVLYPSWYEGFGLPLHEAAKWHIPCLVSSRGALPETAPRGAIILPPDKLQLWVIMARAVLEHPGEYVTTSQYDRHMSVAPLIAFLNEL
jgi:hypothetical protein